MKNYEAVTVKADIDEEGNGAFPSTSNIITHDGVPLRDFIKQNVYTVPNGMQKNNLNIIQIDEDVDIKTIKTTGTYFIPTTPAGTTPVDGTGCCFDVYASTDDDRVLIVHYRHNGTSWRNDLFHGVWQGWKQITETHVGITYLNGWVTNGHGPIVTKIGDTVWLNAILRNGITTAGTIIANVPSGYRPVGAIPVVITSQSGNVVGDVDTKGNIKANSALPTNATIQITSMWLVK